MLAVALRKSMSYNEEIMVKDTSVTLRMSDELKQALLELAVDDRRTLSSYIEVVLEKHVEDHLRSQPTSASSMLNVFKGQSRRHARKREQK
jgi:predicted DNA-binding protein